jgi:hypothetical protein
MHIYSKEKPKAREMALTGFLPKLIKSSGAGRNAAPIGLAGAAKLQLLSMSTPTAGNTGGAIIRVAAKI